MTAFSRRVTDVGEIHVVSLVGELDMETAEGLADWLVEISGSVVVVDLSGLTFMDSSGIAAVVKARAEIENAGSELKLTRPVPNVARVLEIVGLSEWVHDWDPVWEPKLTA